ncbi:hypothetical protein [Streptomyces heilongjiangensis]|uniref:Uncharacterized protein n=1 Tax=Streptomyces heilongjiangensis TaxID=945052 RepID=A0ABW1BKU1_9ACTN|nr:hypothetical protein [Streptomyces heilongjiangensis]MDC2951945.1 hypothetical protein [Streptomyces heilongjiangensis]
MPFLRVHAGAAAAVAAFLGAVGALDDVGAYARAVLVPAGVDEEAPLRCSDGEGDDTAGRGGLLDDGLEAGGAGGDVLTSGAGEARVPLFVDLVLECVLLAYAGQSSGFRAAALDVLAGEGLE